MGLPIAVAAACVIGAAGVLAQQAPRPTFRSGVDLVAVEVQVVDRDGRPIPALTASDFDVRIDGRKRTVVSSDLISYHVGARDTSRVAGTAARPEPAKRLEDRMYILAVDEASFRPGDAMVMRESARRFLKSLTPSDMVGIFKFPVFERALDLTHDHASVEKVFERVMGTYAPLRGQYDLLPSEVVEITAGDKDTFAEVVRRECAGAPDPSCPMGVEAEARMFAAYAESDAAARILGLRLLLDALSDIPGRKNLVVMSAGMLAAMAGGRPDVTSMLLQVGKQAAVSNTNLYVLHMDNSFFEGLVPPVRKQPDPRDPPLIARSSRDGQAFAMGLERLADAASGAYIRIQAGTPDYAFDRVLRETSAYYLLGVETESRDRNGRLHFLRVGVKTKGAAVRSRSHVFIPRHP